jgi:DNA-binding MarR family transcriptional regulator
MERDPDDHRATLVSITRIGTKRLREANDVLTAARFGIGALTLAEQAQLTRLMRKVRSAHGDVDS